jgi:hypothetical protein
MYRPRRHAQTRSRRQSLVQAVAREPMQLHWLG